MQTWHLVRKQVPYASRAGASLLEKKPSTPVLDSIISERERRERERDLNHSSRNTNQALLVEHTKH